MQPFQFIVVIKKEYNIDGSRPISDFFVEKFSPNKEICRVWGII